MLKSVVLLFCRKKKGGVCCMNEKQKRFCEEFVKCDSAAEAYKRAGYKAASAKCAANCASRLLENDGIRQLIDELRNKIQGEKIMNAAERRETLSEIARNKEESPQDRIRAIDTMNKMDGLYIQKTQLSGSDGGPLVFAWEGGGDGK